MSVASGCLGLLRLSRLKLVSDVNNVLNNIMSRVSSSIADVFSYWLSVCVNLSMRYIC